ncbi:MAG TPA: baseplate assembly protein [Trichormus sp. M33_DOE_039]|nr:baseplate assembly protein [Trichormus sp. M33_DOE_039]
MRQFFGKYRGKVENNIDPQKIGRLQVSVPAVLGEGRNSWAMPCVPYAGVGVGFFAIPPNGANLWVEFEGGDPDYPIWTGCFWGTGEAPAIPIKDEIKVLKTDTGSITFNDLPGAGGITIETPAGMKIAISATGIEITNGQSTIQLTGPQVSVNNGALEVI